jgi:hypothetical protein
MAKVAGLDVAKVRRIWAAHRLNRHRWRVFKLDTSKNLARIGVS